MPFAIRLRRLGYRVAHGLLRFYWYLARPAVTGVKAVIIDGQKVLLVQHTYGSRSWDFPGGRIKRHESPLSAVSREMAEELGIASARWERLGEVTGEMHHRRDTLCCYRAELSDPTLELELSELGAVRWFARDRLPAELGRYVPAILALAP
jgi:8-oxo-dGTP pyrophosphatase MutT (NUDIX family)